MSSSDALNDFQVYIQKIENETKNIRNDLLQETSCSKPPQLHSSETIDVLLHNKLKLESELESLLSCDLKFLPENKDIFLNLAKESAQNTALRTSQALAYQKEVNKKLEGEKNTLEELIQNAKAVESNLNDFIENRSEVDYIVSMKRKYSNCGKIFLELRQELSWYLNSRFSSDDEESLPMDGILEKITKQFLADPNDPYVDFGENVKEEHLTFLIRTNLIIRHPKECSKFRLLDFRRN